MFGVLDFEGRLGDGGKSVEKLVVRSVVLVDEVDRIGGESCGKGSWESGQLFEI